MDKKKVKRKPPLTIKLTKWNSSSKFSLFKAEIIKKKKIKVAYVNVAVNGK